jgi:predicted DNA-binding WGR domain protein
MSCYLIKVDTEKNQRSFYSLHLAPDLFGGWSVVREWGRLGSGGTLRLDPFDSETAAQDALEGIKAAKLKKGYLVISS